MDLLPSITYYNERKHDTHKHMSQNLFAYMIFKYLQNT